MRDDASPLRDHVLATRGAAGAARMTGKRASVRGGLQSGGDIHPARGFGRPKTPREARPPLGNRAENRHG